MRQGGRMRVVPQLRARGETYGAAGPTIVRVDSPEVARERAGERVTAAPRELGIRYPVVQDDDVAIWKRSGVRAWPSAAVADRRGVIRHRHIGEGASAETEALIRQLLGEGG